MLRGITVVALEQAVAAPLCTAKLADLGARVIKVERPAVGDFARSYDANASGSSTYFAWLNRGKESLAADIKAPADRDLLLRILAEEADVFVQNLAPGAAARAGFGADALRRANDRLVTLDISGYGATGPRSNYKAYDLLVAAEAGLCDVTGSAEAPGRVGVSICDITAGSNGFAAVLQGLYQRERTGAGAGFEVSLFSSVAEVMAVPYLQTKYSDVPVRRAGLKHPSIAPYGAFRTLDGRSVLISVQNEREWGRLCSDVLRRPELAADARFATATQRVHHREALDEAVQSVFSEQPADTIVSTLLDAGIAFGELNDVQGLVDHPQLHTLSYRTEKGDTVSVPAPAVRPGPEVVGDVPSLGQHTDAISAEFSLRKGWPRSG